MNRLSNVFCNYISVLYAIAWVNIFGLFYSGIGQAYGWKFAGEPLGLVRSMLLFSNLAIFGFGMYFNYQLARAKEEEQEQDR